MRRFTYAGQDLTDEQVDELLDAAACNVERKIVVVLKEYRSVATASFLTVATESSVARLFHELLPYMLHELAICLHLRFQLLYQKIADAGEFAREVCFLSPWKYREQPNFELRGVSFETKLPV